MPTLKHLVFLIAILATPAFAADDKPSEDSIRQLLAMTNARKLVDSQIAQMDGALKANLQGALRGKPMTPERQKIIDTTREKTLALAKDMLSWDKLEPIYINTYRNSFSQDEINGLIAFYKTPSGQALITKMPVVVQQTMIEVQKLSMQFGKQFDDLSREMIAQLDAVPENAKPEKAKH